MTPAGQNRQGCGREHRSLRAIALLLLISLLLAGCAGHKAAYKRSAKLTQNKQYDRAIEQLEEAIALAEKGKKHKFVTQYREELEAIKQQASLYYYEQAEERFTQADLGRAQTLIQRCVTYCPEEQLYQAFNQRVQEAIAEAEDMRTEALELAEEKQWKAAVARMEEALHIYRTMPGGEGDLKHIQDRAYQYHLDRAEESLRQNDLPTAQNEAQTALAYREKGPEAEAVLRTIKDRREATVLISRGRMLLEASDYPEALRVLEQALDLHPSHAELPGLLARARQGVCETWIAQGRQAMTAGQYAQALILFRQSGDLLPGYGDTNALTAEAEAQLVKIHMAASRRYLDNGLSGCAVVHAVAALGYESSNADARAQLSQSAAQVRQAVQYTVGFAGIRTRPQYRAEANQLESAILSHLSAARVTNVSIVNSPEIKALFTSPEIDPMQPIDPKSMAPVAHESGFDALVAGRIVESTVIRETETTGNGTSVYQDGYRSEPNPDYIEAEENLRDAIQDLDKARKRLAEAEARLARYDHIDPTDPVTRAKREEARAAVNEARQRLINTATDVAAAEAFLASTPKEQVVPNMVEHIYPIQKVTWTARITCIVKMFDATTGELIMAEQIEGRHAQSDRMVAADPAHNVPEDRLELPDERLLLEAATKSLMTKLKPALNAALGKHGQRFAQAMQQAQAAGDIDQTLDNAVKYIFAYPNGADQTARMRDYIRQYLGQEDALLDIRSLLRTHCQVLR